MSAASPFSRTLHNDSDTSRKRVFQARHWLTAVCLSIAVLTGACSSDNTHEPVPRTAFELTALTPASGAFGQKIVFTFEGLTGEEEELVAKFSVDGEVLRVPLLSGPEQELWTVAPVLVSGDVTVTVEENGAESNSLPFTATAAEDPTPGTAGNEPDAMFQVLAELAYQADHELGIGYYPFLVSAGFGDEAGDISDALLALSEALEDIFGEEYLGQLTEEQWAVVDGLIGSESGLSVHEALTEAAELLSHSSTGEALYNIATVTNKIADLIDTLNIIDTALQVAIPLAALADPSGSIVASATLAREILGRVIGILEAVQVILENAPSAVVENSLVIKSQFPDYYINNHLQNGPSPACLLISQGIAAGGAVDLDNRFAPGFGELANKDLPEALGPIMAILSLIDAPYLKAEEIDVPITLRVTDGNANAISVVEGAFATATYVYGEEPALIQVQIYPNLDIVRDDCTEAIIRGHSCIQRDEADILRQVEVLDKPRIDSVTPAQAFLGQNLVVEGSCMAAVNLNFQEVYFTGVDTDDGEILDDFLFDYGFSGFSLEVPDGVSGNLYFEINGLASNEFEIEIRNPVAFNVPPSALIGEYWPVGGVGFSHKLSHNLGVFHDSAIVEGAGPMSPYPPAGVNEAAHNKINFVVPSNAVSGPFHVETNTYLTTAVTDVTVRSIKISGDFAPESREAMRPSVALDADTGTRHIVYFDRQLDDEDTYAFQIVASRLETGEEEWSTPVVVNDDDFSEGDDNVYGMPLAPYRAAIAAAGGMVWAVWIGGDNEVHMARSDGGAAWSQLPVLTDSGRTHTQVALAAEGSNVIVVYSQEGTLDSGFGLAAEVEYLFSDDGGDNWYPPVQLSASQHDAADPSVSMAGGLVAVAWSEAVSPASEEPDGFRTIVAKRSPVAPVPDFSGGSLFDAADDRIHARNPSIAARAGCQTDVLVAWEQSEIPASVFGNMTDMRHQMRDRVFIASGPGQSSPIAPYETDVEEIRPVQSPALAIDGDCIPVLLIVRQGFSGNSYSDFSEAFAAEENFAEVVMARSFDNGLHFEIDHVSDQPGMYLQEQEQFGRVGFTAVAAAGRAEIFAAWQHRSNLSGPVNVRTMVTTGDPAVPSDYPPALTEEIDYGVAAFVWSPFVQVADADDWLDYNLYYEDTLFGVWASEDRSDYGLRRLTRLPLKAQRADLSPSGYFLSYTYFGEIVVADADGANPVVSTFNLDDLRARSPYFNASENTIAFRNQRGWGVIPAHGGEYTGSFSTTEALGIRPWPDDDIQEDPLVEDDFLRRYQWQTWPIGNTDMVVYVEPFTAAIAFWPYLTVYNTEYPRGRIGIMNADGTGKTEIDGGYGDDPDDSEDNGWVGYTMPAITASGKIVWVGGPGNANLVRDDSLWTYGVGQVYDPPGSVSWPEPLATDDELFVKVRQTDGSSQLHRIDAEGTFLGYGSPDFGQIGGVCTWPRR